MKYMKTAAIFVKICSVQLSELMCSEFLSKEYMPWFALIYLKCNKVNARAVSIVFVFESVTFLFN